MYVHDRSGQDSGAATLGPGFLQDTEDSTWASCPRTADGETFTPDTYPIRPPIRDLQPQEAWGDLGWESLCLREEVSYGAVECSGFP